MHHYLLDNIISTQSTPQNSIFTYRRAHTLFQKKPVVFAKDKRWWACTSFRWKAFQLPQMDKISELKQKRVLVIRAVATLEPKPSAQIRYSGSGNLELVAGFGSDSRDNSSEEPDEDLDAKEKLRRMRISKANKGNTPWNKGRKHSPETLQRIRERTRIAMQHPKVKMKLVNFGHAQSKETRAKIGDGVRAGWERRREKLMLQETCYAEWQNLIAEASRKGSTYEKELQWDSYTILDHELEQEWLASVELRKNTPRPKGNKRAPKSPEQRRKISEAISAKWADSEYRNRVCSALSTYYGSPVGVGNQPRRKPSGEKQPKIQIPKQKKVKDTVENVKTCENSHTKLRRSKVPMYKDPLASSKLEMIKNIRAERAAVELKKTEAIKQAKILILEAEKAAKALEANATRSPLVRASLIESRELIAQAIQSLTLLECSDIDLTESGQNPSTDDVEEHANNVCKTEREEVINGFGNPENLPGLLSNVEGKDGEAAADKSATRFNVNGLSYDVEEEELPTIQTCNRSIDLGLLSSPLEVEKVAEQSTSFTVQQLRDRLVGLNGKKINGNELVGDGDQAVYCFSDEKARNVKPHSTSFTPTTRKKWIRGKLVEIVEQEDD